MESITRLSYEQASALSEIFKTKYRADSIDIDKIVLIEECGLISKTIGNYYIDSKNKVSHLYVINNKKWMLAKIKYAI